jgi:hypothetical protein
MGSTYARAVFIGNMAILERELDLLLVLCRKLVITVDEVSVAFAYLNQVLYLLGSDTSPMVVNKKCNLA